MTAKYGRWGKLGAGEDLEAWENDNGLDFDSLQSDGAAAEAKRQAREVRAASNASTPATAFLMQLIAEAEQDPKTDSDPRGAALERYLYQEWASGTCVWCVLDPARGKTMLCQACNVYRRTFKRPPTQKAVDRRRGGRVDAEAVESHRRDHDLDWLPHR